MAGSRSPSPFSTPKRKREQLNAAGLSLLSTTGADFSFGSSLPSSQENGSDSPRTKVAHRFRGLAIGSGGGVVASENGSGGDMSPQDPGVGARKRIKLPSPEPSNNTPQTAPIAVGTATADDTIVVRSPATNASSIVVGTIDSVLAGADSQKTRKSPPLSTPFLDGKARIHKRAGTPPLRSKRDDNDGGEGEGRDAVVDPVRAALTWHEDEITIYDPDDSDDDGTGVNGIGFKPTPAVAHARTVRRKQQLVDYRKREEREARAQRSRRRRGSPLTASLLESKETADERRKVRFLESQAGAVRAR